MASPGPDSAPSPSPAYVALLERLFGARRKGVVFGLERVRAALAQLGEPHHRIAVRVQIGGTNGKGSTAAFVEAIARAAGLRTGLFTSPHLSSFRERFVIDGVPIAEDALVRAAAAGAGREALTFFEETVVIAAVAFAHAGVDIGIFEVGLGGRLDATTALEVHVAAVTGVALDHQEYLGDDVASIAAEKAGVFRAGQQAILGCAGRPEALPLLAACARDVGVSALRQVSGRDCPDWPLSLAGAHQRDNAACALAVADAIEVAGGWCIPQAARRAGLSTAVHPGRFETIGMAPLTVADGAHNPDAAAAVAPAIAALPGTPRWLVLAVSEGKDAAGMATALCPGFDGVVVTRSRNPRAMAPAELARHVAPLAPVHVEAHGVAAALARARDSAGSAGLVVVAGSLFAVGEAREVLLGVTPDPLVVTDPVGRAG